MCLGFHSASKTNENCEYFVGETWAVCRLTTLSHSCTDFLEYWESHLSPPQRLSRPVNILLYLPFHNILQKNISLIKLMK